MAEGLGATQGGVVELGYELGQPDWSDAVRARGRVRGIRGRLRPLILPVLLAVAVWLLTDNVFAAGFFFLGGMVGLVVRTRVLTARQARMSAPLGRWSVTVADSEDAVRFACAHMETRRGWRSLGGYVETTAGFVLLGPAPYLLLVHYLPKRAMGKDATDRLRGVLGSHLPHRGVRLPQH